jgi:hypothetical protein
MTGRLTDWLMEATCCSKTFVSIKKSTRHYHYSEDQHRHFHRREKIKFHSEMRLTSYYWRSLDLTYVTWEIQVTLLFKTVCGLIFPYEYGHSIFLWEPLYNRWSNCTRWLLLTCPYSPPPPFLSRTVKIMRIKSIGIPIVNKRSLLNMPCMLLTCFSCAQWWGLPCLLPEQSPSPIPISCGQLTTVRIKQFFHFKHAPFLAPYDLWAISYDTN